MLLLPRPAKDIAIIQIVFHEEDEEGGKNEGEIAGAQEECDVPDGRGERRRRGEVQVNGCRGGQGLAGVEPLSSCFLSEKDALGVRGRNTTDETTSNTTTITTITTYLVFFSTSRPCFPPYWIWTPR